MRDCNPHRLLSLPAFDKEYFIHVNAADIYFAGIDVQAELRAKTGSPHQGPTHITTPVSAPTTTQPSMQRTVFNRHHPGRRSFGEMASKTDPIHGLPRVRPERILTSPSLSQGTSMSHTSSPTTASSLKSPTFVSPHGAVGSPVASPLAHSHPQLRPLHHTRQQFGAVRAAAHQHQQQQPRPHQTHNRTHSGALSSGSVVSNGPANGQMGTAGPGSSTYLPSPYQNHIEQLGESCRFARLRIAGRVCLPT